MQRTEKTDTVGRRRQRRAALASLAVTVLMAVTATGCAYPVRDLGPLPPRFSGPPLPADTVVSEMTSILAAEGIEVERETSDDPGRCAERLSGRHAPETVDTALNAAFVRARSEHGWKTGPDLGSGRLTLVKNNWTVTAAFAGTPAQGIQAPVVVSLVCLEGGETSAVPAAPSAPASTPASP